MRLDWDAYWMSMTLVVASRATCPRLSCGCVIVKDNEVLSMGYNGAARNQAQCDQVGCYMKNGHCVRTIHAETNALLRADWTKLDGAYMYLTGYPCLNCAKLIANTKIARLFYGPTYHVNLFAASILDHLDPVELQMPPEPV